MDHLFRYSKEQKAPIEIIYFSQKGKLTQRQIIVNEIQEDIVRAYCFTKKKPRMFKKENILSAAKIKPQRGAMYA